MAANDQDHARALMWYMEGISAGKIGDRLRVTRNTIQNWKKAGLPHAMTGGLNWDDFIEAEKKREHAAVVSRAKEQLDKTSIEFLAGAKQDVMQLFEVAKSRLLDGEGELRYSDVEKLLTLFIRLDNQSADRIVWMQNFLRKVVRALYSRVKDERTLKLIESDLVGIAAEEQQKMGPIPNATALPSPADFTSANSEWALEADLSAPPVKPR